MNIQNQLILVKVSKKRFDRTLRGLQKKKSTRRHETERNFRKNQADKNYLQNVFGGKITYEKILDKWLPLNLRYLLNNSKSDFNLSQMMKEDWFPDKKSVISSKILTIPRNFSLIDNPKESFEFLRKTTAYLLFGQYKLIEFTYEECERINIGAQVLLDIILREVIAFSDRCSVFKQLNKLVKVPQEIGLTNLQKTPLDIKKILFSVGSPAVLTDINFKTEDIIPYRLCIFNRDESFSRLKTIEQKEIDTTELVDYVINSLARLNKTLTPEKLENLCTIIGEVLINAEEHSTTKHRFSIGYFQETKENGKHLGLFRLVILNFGKTIYEKFADVDCPNKEVVEKMKNLSEKYNKENWFKNKEFEEETLWTLYALQEGITSVSDKRRGNGSIQFIDSFFNMKGETNVPDDKSRMTILSGNASIVFDGTYRITEKVIDNERFKVMTFNESGNIENKPDKNYVKVVDNYFPGTIISAKIFFHKDDFTDDAK